MSSEYVHKAIEALMEDSIVGILGKAKKTGILTPDMTATIRGILDIQLTLAKIKAIGAGVPPEDEEFKGLTVDQLLSKAKGQK